MRTSISLLLLLLVSIGEARAQTSDDPVFGDSQMFASIQKDLVTAEGLQLLKTQRLAASKYVILYFSAEWCPGCVSFTPKLVEFYKQNQDQPFDVIFVSNDKSEEEMLAHMKRSEMSWPGLRYLSFSRLNVGKKYCGKWIPRLVVLDEVGNIMLQSEASGVDTGPANLLEEFKRKAFRKPKRNT